MDKKVLVLTRNAWDNNISTGNTASNFFSNWDENSIANLYCRNETPENDICLRYYKITESELLKNVFHKEKSGERIIIKRTEIRKKNDKEILEKKAYDFFRNNRWVVLLWIREVIWLLGGWRNRKLNEFIEDFNPDIIYMPIYNCLYMHDILHYVQKVSGAKIMLFTGDDIYSLRQYSLSPLYWINRLIIRRKIKKTLQMAELCYSLSELQVDELSAQFGDKFKVMRKGMVVNDRSIKQDDSNTVLKIVYTGNITSGRWVTLSKLSESIKKINTDGVKIQLYIYSGNALTTKMKKKLLVEGQVFFMGEVHFSKVFEIQKASDLVVHVESFSLKYKYQTRLSFSTKLVDYFQNSKCILAIGWEKSNSISYLKENDAALVVTELDKIEDTLLQLLDKRKIIRDYECKAWICGCKNHNLNEIQNDIQKDILSI